ncbi:MAG: Asp-tRNA(Asn)/Glu-tRNA(Gln) amidotransferase subunit GatC [Myxococcales bacterium]|jgi:aspartyl-tRNA(Asn)/glutamyl-tRNA(Gln) amidotransferase subunit C
MNLSVEEVRRVAQLARLRLTAEEEQRYARQLGEVLAYAEQLRELDTSHIPPTAHAAELPNLLREDELQPSLEPEVALANAPAREGSAIAVPKIIE